MAGLFPDPAGRYDFATLQRLTGISASDLSRRLWAGAWAGGVTNDSFGALRKGIETRFEVPEVRPPAGRRPGAGGRGAFSRWKGSLPFAGNWLLLPEAEPAADPLESEERCKERVRLLFDRYGLLFRELLQREAAPFRWPALFRSLRLMELSGEILSGCFFDGIPGPQFISHRAFRRLQRNLPEKQVFWINATDPASLCGLPLEELRGSLPRRVAGTHLVYHGSDLVVVSARNGRALTFRVDADNPDLPRYFGFIHHLLTAPFVPRGAWWSKPSTEVRRPEVLTSTPCASASRSCPTTMRS